MTTTAAPVGRWTGKRFAHEAFLFDTDAAVHERVVPFVEEGLAREEPVVVVAGDLVRTLLAEALGARTGELEVLAPAESFWFGGHETLASYHESMLPLLAAGRPWRLVGEPTWLATPGGAVWSRFEAVANEAFATYPYYSLCLHDRRRLAPAVLDTQLRVHPLVWDGTRPVASPAYEQTDRFLRSVEPDWTPAPPGADVLRITDPHLSRPALHALLDSSALGSRTGEVLLTVFELVTNAVRAGGVAEVSHWTEDGLELWQVHDHGPGLLDPTAGYVPPPVDLDSGRGLWLARSLADDSAIRASEAGTTVRLYFATDTAARPGGR
jgi:anti-sigma regulatory factor (Ser/Thr protein kinase)